MILAVMLIVLPPIIGTRSAVFGVSYSDGCLALLVSMPGRTGTRIMSASDPKRGADQARDAVERLMILLYDSGVVETAK